MNARKTARWLIIDSLFLALSILFLLIDLLIIGDILWSMAALLGVFIFSTRVGRDVRRLRALKASAS